MDEFNKITQTGGRRGFMKLGDEDQAYELIGEQAPDGSGWGFEFRPWCDPNRTFFEFRAESIQDHRAAFQYALRHCIAGLGGLRDSWPGTTEGFDHMKSALEAAAAAI